MVSACSFLVECDEVAFRNAGFENMLEEEYRKICEGIFVEEFEGHALINNNSIWRRFPVLENARWYHKNRVLVGDALHTAHYSIGSGTRLAMEDVIALVDALKENDFDVTKALPAYQEKRQPVLTKLTAAALSSALWYENFGEHMALDPWELARSYALRSGRLSIGRRKNISSICRAVKPTRKGSCFVMSQVSIKQKMADEIAYSCPNIYMLLDCCLTIYRKGKVPK